MTNESTPQQPWPSGTGSRRAHKTACAYRDGEDYCNCGVTTRQQPAQVEPDLVKVLREICADPGTMWPWPLDQNEAIAWRDHIDRLSAENAALLKDKERLDWLQENGLLGSCVWRGIPENGWLIVGQNYTCATLRDAIDAALAPTQQTAQPDKPASKEPA